MIIPPLTIRCSSLPMSGDCARRQAAKSLPAQIAEWGYSLTKLSVQIGAAVGTASHAGVAHVLLEKIRTGEIHVRAETTDRAEVAFKEQAAFGIMWDAVTPNSDVAMRQVGRIVNLYAVTVAVEVEPIAVELHLKHQTAKGNVLEGHIDLTTKAIRDLKTGKFQTANITQYGAYSLLTRKHGGEVEFVAEDYFKRVAMKDPQPQPVTTRYEVGIAEAAAAAAIARVERNYEEFMSTGNPMAFPANPNSVLCDPKFCPAWGTEFCKEHAR